MKRLLGLLAVVPVLACADPFTITMERVAGYYRAVSFTTTDSTGTTDWMSLDAVFEIGLLSNGATHGVLWVPGGGEGGTNIQESMGGGWTLNGDTVRFSQRVDTFVRDMAFVAREDPSDHNRMFNRLEGDQIVDGVRIRLVLTR